jgi:hypothetical protein
MASRPPDFVVVTVLVRAGSVLVLVLRPPDLEGTWKRKLLPRVAAVGVVPAGCSTEAEVSLFELSCCCDDDCLRRSEPLWSLFLNPHRLGFSVLLFVVPPVPVPPPPPPSSVTSLSQPFEDGL